MGVCFSKKNEPNPTPPTSDPISNVPKIPRKKKSNIAVKAEIDKTENEARNKVKFPKQASQASALLPVLPVEKKPVFLITQTPKRTKSNSSANSKEEKNAEEPKKPNPTKLAFVGPSKTEEIRPTGTVRTSSCTKEEVDAILIQCGRLSRNSSGKASNDTAGHKKYSGSKRSYDFDNDKSGRDEEEDCDQKPVPRPSPRRRRTPNRERSGSRERGSRVSRSPGRRSENPAASSSSGGGGDRPRQPPAKMVSVPAREKGVAVTAANRRNIASPRSRSPANTSRVSDENALSQPQSLSRSSSRKQEQSPFRRSTMTEIDDNSVKGNHNQKWSDQRNNISYCIRDQLICRAKEKQPQFEIVEEAKESKGASEGSSEIESTNNRGSARTGASRRSSRDLDHILGLNADNEAAANYTSLLLEDIQNYHQQRAGFSLPACMSKACSILEAVADLNSSSSNQSNNDNGQARRRVVLSSKEPFLESEVVMKDDLMEPSLHKYISVRDLGGDETEPQESAGSNSFVGQLWPSPWELSSVDSTKRHWNSQANNGKEVEETLVPETPESRFRSGEGSRSNSGASATGLSNKKRDVDRRCQLQRSGGGSSGVSGKTRAQSLPVAAATSREAKCR